MAASSRRRWPSAPRDRRQSRGPRPVSPPPAMTRLVSGAVLVLAAVAAVWWAPGWLLFLIAQGLLILALREYRDLVVALGLSAPGLAASAVAMVSCAAVAAEPRSALTP